MLKQGDSVRWRHSRPLTSYDLSFAHPIDSVEKTDDHRDAAVVFHPQHDTLGRCTASCGRRDVAVFDRFLYFTSVKGADEWFINAGVYMYRFSQLDFPSNQPDSVSYPALPSPAKI